MIMRSFVFTEYEQTWPDKEMGINEKLAGAVYVETWSVVDCAGARHLHVCAFWPDEEPKTLRDLAEGRK